MEKRENEPKKGHNKLAVLLNRIDEISKLAEENRCIANGLNNDLNGNAPEPVPVCPVDGQPKPPCNGFFEIAHLKVDSIIKNLHIAIETNANMLR